MCLGIPGRLVEVYQRDGLPMGKVEFGGILKETCLQYTPEAQVGDYVIVHVGFAISQVDQAEAQEIFEYLEAIGELGDAELKETNEAVPPSPPAPLPQAGEGRHGRPGEEGATS